MEENLPARIVDETELPTTRRVISDGAEKWLYRPIQCLDHGFVYLVDYLGSDHAIAEAARVSYGKGTKKASDDRGLIRRLCRDMHTSPFEMVELKFHAKMPIFVARQWIRHRTASVNEYSGRYSEMSDEFYLPASDVLRKQSKINKQGRDEELADETKEFVRELLLSEYDLQRKGYHKLLEIDVAKELARIGLSVANYTEWYWKIDLHNLMHFLRLRLAPEAQYEIRVFAEAMARIVKDAVPVAFDAFEDYRLSAMTLSRMEVEFVSVRANDKVWPMTTDMALEILREALGNKTDALAAIAKFQKLGLVAY